MKWTLPFAMLAAGCAVNTQEQDMVEVSREVADGYYKSGKFFDASERFSYVLKHVPDDWPALIGYANSLREAGNEFYLQATELESHGNMDGARQTAMRAYEFHTGSRDAFVHALQLRPNDAEALYGMGLLFYHRASGAYRLFAEKEEDVVHACFKNAQGCFEKYVEMHPSSFNGHRYLGLSLIGMERPKDARPHIEFFLQQMREAEKRIQAAVPANDDERARRDQDLMQVKKDIDDAEEVLKEIDNPPPPPP